MTPSSSTCSGRFPLPVEVIPMARSLVARKLAGLGGQPVLRQGFKTDNGNEILDVHNLKISDPATLEAQIGLLVGVVEVGLFARRGADVLLVAGDGEVRTLAALSRSNDADEGARQRHAGRRTWDRSSIPGRFSTSSRSMIARTSWTSAAAMAPSQSQRRHGRLASSLRSISIPVWLRLRPRAPRR